MSLIVPKIVYPSGGGTTLTFSYPPRMVPAQLYEATRRDNLSSAGVRESIYERLDIFLEFTMEYVKIGADMAAWDAFFVNALAGNAFDYYPDSTQGAFTTYLLEDTNWTAAYKQLGMYTFKVRFRKRVAWP